MDYKNSSNSIQTGSSDTYLRYLSENRDQRLWKEINTIYENFRNFTSLKDKTENSIVSWKSSNTKVVTVSGKTNGTSTVTAGALKGTATITITLKSGLKKTVKVTVQPTTVKTTKISGIPAGVTLKKGQSRVLQPVLAPVTSQEKVTYTSSKTSVAVVASNGKITAKAKGTAVITVKSGTKTVKCKITVN